MELVKPRIKDEVVRTRAEVFSELAGLGDDTPINVKDAAIYLGFCEDTIRDLFNRGKLEGFQNGRKGRIKIRLGALRSFKGKKVKSRT